MQNSITILSHELKYKIVPGASHRLTYGEYGILIIILQLLFQLIDDDI